MDNTFITKNLSPLKKNKLNLPFKVLIAIILEFFVSICRLDSSLGLDEGVEDSRDGRDRDE